MPAAVAVGRCEGCQEFLEDFQTVSREQAIAALEQAKESLLATGDGC